MKLDDYLREHGLTSAQFAEEADLAGKQTVHNYRHGLRFPTPKNLRRIHDATKGAVTANDFMDQHAPPTVLLPRPRPKRTPDSSPSPTPKHHEAA